MYLCTCELARLHSKKWDYVIRHAYLQSIYTHAKLHGTKYGVKKSFIEKKYPPDITKLDHWVAQCDRGDYMVQ